MKNNNKQLINLKNCTFLIEFEKQTFIVTCPIKCVKIKLFIHDKRFIEKCTHIKCFFMNLL